MFVEHGKLYYSVMANYTIRSWQFSTRILPWLFSACRPKEHGNFPFCSMVNLFFITMANFILHLLLQIFLFLTHGKFTFTAMAKLHIYHGNFIFSITENFIFSFSVIFLAWWHFYFTTMAILFFVTWQIILLDHGNFFLFLYFSWWQLYLVTSQSFSCNMDDKNCLPWQAHLCAYILPFSIFR